MRTPRAYSKQNAAGPTLVQPDPPAELVEEALDFIINAQLNDFAQSLDLARSIWRKYRSLVEADTFPEKLAAVLIDQTGTGPNDDCAQFEDELKALEPGYRESIRPLAIQTARRWMARREIERLEEERPESEAEREAREFLDKLHARETKSGQNPEEQP